MKQEKDKGCELCNMERRKVLAGAGKLAAGAAIASALGGMSFATKVQAKAAAEKWPWPYVKLDPEKTAEIAYNEWYRVFCGGAVISSIFGQLREKVGEPYTSFPIDAFVFLEGGQVGWGTICGSNAGANIVANLIVGPRIAGAKEGHFMSEDIMEWYSSTALPVFKPKNPRVTAHLPTTVSESPLCHISVGKWMKKAGKPIKSAERKDRCARVTASVAYQMVTMLNDWKDGKYEPSSDHAPVKEYGITAQFNCMECHGDDVPSPPGS